MGSRACDTKVIFAQSFFCVILDERMLLTKPKSYMCILQGALSQGGRGEGREMRPRVRTLFYPG
jgi:hypothetical protein